MTDDDSPVKLDDPIWPTCPECGARDGIAHVEVDAAEDGPRGETHTARRYDLACGHTIRNPAAELSAGIVDLIRTLETDADEILTVRGRSQ